MIIKKKTDAQLIDALEQFIKSQGGLLIHDNGYDAAKNCAGLGLACTGRTLREALEQCFRDEEPDQVVFDAIHPPLRHSYL